MVILDNLDNMVILVEIMAEVTENWNVEWKRKTRSTIVASRGIAVMG